MDLQIEIKKKLVSLHLCFSFTSPWEKMFQIQRPRNLSIQKVNRIENIEQPRYKYRGLSKNSSSRRNVCNVITKYFERGSWNQDSRIFKETFLGVSGTIELLASCFVVVWILSSISSIFCIMSFGDRTIYHPNKLFTDVANTGHREGIQGMRKLKMGTKLNQDPIIIHEWNGHLAIFLAVL